MEGNLEIENKETEEENIIEENLEEFNREIDFEKAEDNKEVCLLSDKFLYHKFFFLEKDKDRCKKNSCSTTSYDAFKNQLGKNRYNSSGKNKLKLFSLFNIEKKRII